MRYYKNGNIFRTNTAWKVSKYGVISGPYIFVFGLNTEIYGVHSPNQEKYGPEVTPYLDTFYAVKIRTICKRYEIVYVSNTQKTPNVITSRMKIANYTEHDLKIRGKITEKR